MKKLFVSLMVIVLSVSIMVSCKEDSTQKQGEKVQESVMQRAIANVPTPEVDHFLTRRAMVRWMERMDVPNKLFYIYVTTQMGDPIGYFVAQYRPVSTATFLTPTMRRDHGTQGSAALPTNALDGTYYGTGTAVDQYFWFCAETDALIELKDYPYILSDQPLSFDVPRIYVEKQ